MSTKGLDYDGLVYFWGKLKATFQEKLVSGTSIKTINNTSLLGSGDIEVAPSVTSTDVPTADTIAEFDSNAHMNSSDKTTQEIESFLTSLGIGSSKYVLSNVGMYGRGDIGEIKAFAGSVLPSGWLLCDGSAVSRTTYSDLFAVIGDTYGVGDGSTTFNLPDLTERFPVGSGTNYAVGSTGGEKTHTLVNNELPKLWGSIPHTAYGESSVGGVFSVVDSGDHYQAQNITGSTTARHYEFNIGNDGAHNNMPPYLGVNYIIYAGNSNSSITNASIDVFYPVGSYYETTDTTFDPNISWGGMWVSETKIKTSTTMNSDETPIKTWIDGNTIYRKILSGTSTSGANAVSISSLDVKNIIRADIIIHNSTNNSWVFGSYVEGTTDAFNWYVSSDLKTLYLRSKSDYAYGPYYIILEYTKNNASAPTIIKKWHRTA